ncbi:TLDc domain-containing protein [Entamoeba marina]
MSTNTNSKIVNDMEMNIINNSIDLLKQWSNKTIFNIIFDSDIDGDGSKNALHNTVFNKNNLYFIHFDGDNNIFGGYISSKIDKSSESDNDAVDACIRDENSFIFSLMRNGKVNNKRYFMKRNCEDEAFSLWVDDSCDALYTFGWDIAIYSIGNCNSLFFDCDYFRYDYKDDHTPLTDIVNMERFEVQRILVIQMN